ncbi:MAG TPA: carbamoyltransferase HypF [Pyrinomonadaceae bacterium]|nr:carbamoyltransferase HypF [Pyrinomonadaceae bacterium]
MARAAKVMEKKRANAAQRLRVVARGAVQGVGFRPFVFRLATELNLRGWVVNSSQGVFAEVEGDERELKDFLLRLERERPPRSFIQSLESSFLDPVGFERFEIRASDDAGEKTALVLPDIATCPDCLRDILDPSNRRHLYPFANCTNCGPRYSIIERLPYDRPHTTMRAFEICDDCRREYVDPLDRRFHAQPNACPACGPRLELWDKRGASWAARGEALRRAAKAVTEGAILAVKGLGGFHLVADALNFGAVERLRQLKRREEKPFALMLPALASVEEVCEVSPLERRLLLSPEAPIVLLRRKADSRQSAIRNPQSAIASSVAPGNPYLGVMLPYTPLHHLLMRELGFPVVATSGNLSDEPICTDEREAVERLGGIADLFLVHDRAIARHVDDSIVRVMAGRELVMRRARGYAPLPVRLREDVPPTLAVGAHMKNAVAATKGRDAFISQHVGDLNTEQSFDAFRRVVENFSELYELRPRVVAADDHPDYRSTRFARATQLPLVSVQHHYAHVLSCMAENELEAPALGVAWDGTGLGADGTVWGGEFLYVTPDSFVRAAHLRTFPLPGGDRAAREPRRSALGLLHELYGDAAFEMRDLATLGAFDAQELRLLKLALARGVGAHTTSSAGRLFDAVASITGLRQRSRFEGQAAMELEFAVEGFETDARYELELPSPCVRALSEPRLLDWSTLVEELIEDARRGLAHGLVSAKFHNALAESIVSVARAVGEERVVLSGGCFQNKYLTERAIERLRAEGFRPYWHQRVPPNDGGIALGQVVAASRAKTDVRREGEF